MPLARFQPPQTSSKATMPRSFMMPCRTCVSSLASSSNHFRSSLIMSSVTGAFCICRPSWEREERIKVASSGSDGAAAAGAADSLSFRSAARWTMSFAFAMRACRSCSASERLSCWPLADACTECKIPLMPVPGELDGAASQALAWRARLRAA